MQQRIALLEQTTPNLLFFSPALKRMKGEDPNKAEHAVSFNLHVYHYCDMAVCAPVVVSQF